MPQYIKKYNKKPLSLPDSGGSDQFPLVDRVASLPSGQTLGHYTNGENIPFSTCTTLQEVLDLLAISTLYPSFTNPSASVTLAAVSGYSSTVEIGATITGFIANVSFNRGLISPYYTGVAPYSNTFRSGAATNYAFSGIITQPTSVSNVSTSTNIIAGSGTNQVSVIVSYATGVQPLDSTGANYDSPYPSGNLSAVTASFQGKYKVWYGPSVTDHVTATVGINAGARTLSNFFVVAQSFLLNPGLVAKDFYVYIPVSSGLSLTNAVVTTTFQNVTTDYILVTSSFEIPDANGVMVLYKKYKMSNAIPYTDSALRHNITIA